jgi:hypothetical protein
MKKIFILALFVLSLNLHGSGGFPHSVGGGGGPDTTSIARDGSRPPTADQPWGNNELTDVGRIELDDGVDQVAIKPGATNDSDGLVFDFTSGNDYALSSIFTSSLLLENTVPGTFTFLNFGTKDNDGTDTVGFGVGRKTGAAGGIVEYVNLAWRADIARYSLDSSAFGGGSANYDIGMQARNWNTASPSILLKTNGNTEFPAGNQIFGDGVTTTTKTGPFTFLGTTAGLPTGVPATLPSGRVAMSFDTTNDKVCFYDAGWVCFGDQPGAHATTHQDGGSDEIDVELAGGISTLTPTGYTPSTAEAGCDATDQLCAHLKGIDDTLSVLNEDNFYVDTVQVVGGTYVPIRTVTYGVDFQDDDAVSVLMDCVGISIDGSEAIGMARRALFRKDGAAATVKIGSGTTTYKHADDNQHNIQTSVSGNNILLEVRANTGDTVEFKCRNQLIIRNATP